MTREALFQQVCECWQRTEDAIAALGEHFETQANAGWTVGDVFRHLTAASHIMSGRIRALLATGELPFPGDDGNAVGVEKFASLDYKMLRIELNTVAGQLSDEDLAQRFTIFARIHAGRSDSTAGAARSRARERGAERRRANSWVWWMYIQRFSDEDLAQRFTIFREEHTLGEVVRARVLHEVGRTT